MGGENVGKKIFDAGSCDQKTKREKCHKLIKSIVRGKGVLVKKILNGIGGHKALKVWFKLKIWKKIFEERVGRNNFLFFSFANF